MMKQTSALFLAITIVICAISITVTGPGCANIVPPTGGPRDSLPPRLVSVKPADSTTNFTGKKISFEFDEFVDLDNIQENLLVSPTPKINPDVQRKLRTVTVTIKDTLEPNTTYSINFGNAIKDINEGNQLKNFTYIFTTGTALDSLALSGKVIVAESGKTDSTLIVVLHSSFDDSAVTKERPRYVTRVDKEGHFTFRNLPSDTFAIYAMKDESGQRRYMRKSQLFAFADSPAITGKSGPFTLYAYTEKEDTVKKPATTLRPGAKATAGATQADKRLRIETNLQGGLLPLLSNLEIYFKQAPLKYFDTSKIIFANEKMEPLRGHRFVQDTSNKKITLFYNWTENTAYNLVVKQDVAEDTSGRKLLRDDTLAFRTKKSSDYGLVRLRLLNLDLSKNPVLQFVQGDQVKFSFPLTSREFYARLFEPGEYELRILFDQNRNGIWDAGEFFGKHIQPEKVQPIPRRLEVKANWDNEVDITL
jgi:hypothetical protein